MQTKVLSIRWLIAGAVALAVLVVTTSLSLYFPRVQQEQAARALRLKALTVSELVASNAKAAIEFDDKETIESIFAGARKDADLSYVVARKPEGETIVGYNDNLAPKMEKLRLAGIDPRRITEPAVFEDDQYVNIVIPVQLTTGERNALVAGFSLARLRQEEQQSRNQALLVGTLFVLLGLAMAYAMGTYFARPLTDLTVALKRLSKGDLLAAKLPQSRVAEIDYMSDSHARVLQALQHIVSRLRTAGNEVNVAAEQILAASQEQEQGSNEQSASIEEITQSMTGIEESARVIAETGHDLMKIAGDIERNIAQGSTAVNSARTGMQQIVEHQKVIGEQIKQLYERSRSVIAVVDIIDSISDRLDLLALNAALEGARAGDVGKGFALVAIEMRRLAENVAGSTREIKDTIQEIQRFTQLVQATSQTGTDVVTRGSQEMDQMAGSVAAVFSLLERTNDLSRRLGVLTQQQLATTRQTTAAMGEISAIANQSLRAAQEMTSVASELANKAVDMRQLVQLFKLEGEATPTDTDAGAGAATTLLPST